MLQAVLSRENLLTALKRVEQNKGSHGGQTTLSNKQLLKYLLHYLTQRFLNIVTASVLIDEGMMPVHKAKGYMRDGYRWLVDIDLEKFFDKVNHDRLRKFQGLDEWIRRRLRMCMWKQWKKPRTKIKRLISLGVPRNKAYEWGNTRFHVILQLSFLFA